jgi:hypothetical protein
MSSVPGREVEVAVLADESGRRARWLRLLARGVSLLFLAWLLVIVLGGFGLNPVDRLPLSGALRASKGPPPLRTLPAPTPPSPADLRPALPAPSASAAVAAGRASAKPGASATAKAKAKAKHRSPLPADRGKSTLSPGHVRKAIVPPGQSRTTTTSPGRLRSNPGQTRHTTTTAPGRAALAPGHKK